MYNFGSFDAFIVKPTIMPDFARNLLHYHGIIKVITFNVGKLFVIKVIDSFCKNENDLIKFIFCNRLCKLHT